MLEFIKAHAYGNDFLFIEREDVRDMDFTALARRLCDRHTGIGADGLIVYQLTPDGASMRLRNADGSRAEVSGNGVRCLAAIVAERHPHLRRQGIAIDTESGEKRLVLEQADGDRLVFRAAMGHPTALRQVRLDVLGQPVDVVALWVGNPQCVVLGPLDDARYRRLGPALEHHPAFPEGTNVEFAAVEAPDRLRIQNLGTRRRSDAGLGHRGVRCRGGGRGPWRRLPRRAGDVTRGHATGRVARGRPVSDRLGGTAGRRAMAAGVVRRFTPSHADNSRTTDSRRFTQIRIRPQVPANCPSCNQ